jgi:ribonuclease HI
VVRDALCPEAHACLAALQAAASQGMQHIILETDSQVLVKALQTNEHDLAQGGVLFREAKFTLATMFSSWSIVHVYRSGNSVAHSLARLGRDRDPDHPSVWVHPLPEFVNNLLGP